MTRSLTSAVVKDLVKASGEAANVGSDPSSASSGTFRRDRAAGRRGLGQPVRPDAGKLMPNDVPSAHMSLGLPFGMGHRMLTIDEVAGWFRVPVATIRGWVRRRSIPYRKVGQVLRFPEAELEAWSVPSPSPQVGREIPLFAPNQVPGRPPPSVKLDISYD